MDDVRTFRTVLPTGQTLWIADLTPEQFLGLVTAEGAAAVVDTALTDAAADLVDPRIGRDMPIMRIADGDDQPFECEAGRCDHCGHRMRAQHAFDDSRSGHGGISPGGTGRRPGRWREIIPPASMWETL